MSTTALFSWTTEDGTTVHTDTPPSATDTTIVELICRRNEQRLKTEGYSSNESFPAHEATMKALPCNLAVLRINYCRIRTFPTLPPTIVELYAEQNDFFHLPETISSLTNLIVLELADGRLESLGPNLPPNLAHCNVSGNALKTIVIENYPPSLSLLDASMNPSDCAIFVTPQNYRGRIILRENVHTHPQFHWNPPRGHREGGNGVEANDTALQPHAQWNGPRGRVQEGRHVVDDSQNVHDSGVQGSTANNIQYIRMFGPTIPKKTPQELFQAIRQRFLATARFQPVKKTGFFGRIKNIFALPTNSSHAEGIISEFQLRFRTPYSMHGTTTFLLCERLWARIEAFPPDVQVTALQRLVEEVNEAKPHCMNGFMVRMVNVLLGLDENVVLRLLPRQILQQRVPLTMRKLREKGGWAEGMEPWEWSRDCFVETCKDLDDCEEKDPSGRREWLETFYEGFVDQLIDGFNGSQSGEQHVEARFTDLGLPDEQWAKRETISRLVQ
jgi:hypothetical protein